MTSSFSNLTLAGLGLFHGAQIQQHLPAICAELSERLPELNTAAKEIARGCTNRAVFLTSGMHALAIESALKVIELTAGRVMTMAETFLGLRHGPLSFLRENTPVICFASADASRRRYEEDLVEDLKGRGLGRIVVVGDKASSGWQHDWFVRASAPTLPDLLRTPFEAPFAQLLAYHLSINADIDPDDPSPDGTVTRVVKPFSIHHDSLEG